VSKRGRNGLLCFALGFATSLAASCQRLEFDDGCGCTPQTARPPFQGSLLVDDVSEYGEGVLTAAPGIETGTIMLTESELTVSYTNEGAAYSVSYAIAEAF
jgi:hypothetical protein